MFKVFAADRQFGKHLLRGTWEPFDSYIFMCSDTQRYVMLGPLFFSFSAFVLVIFFCLFSGVVRVAFLSPASRLSPETNTSSSPLMKPVFRIENSPTRTRDNTKKDKNANNATSVAWRYCFEVIEDLCVSTRLKSLQLFVFIGVLYLSTDTCL